MVNNISAVKNKLRLLLRLVVSLGLSALLGFVIQWPSSSPAQAQSPDSGTPTASPAVTIAATARIDDPLALRNTAVLTADSEYTSDDTLISLAGSYHAYLPFLMKGDANDTPATTPIGSLQAVRAVWVQAEAANTSQKADAMINHVKRGGFNTILYGINAGSVYYRSKLLPQSPSVTAQYDPLAYVVKQAHANGLTVQAWWSCGLAPSSASFRARYPTFDIAQISVVPDGVHWLNYALPEVKQLVGDVVLELAQNYDLDGVHLDYIRYPEDPDPSGATFGANDVPNTVQSAYRRLKAVKPGTQLTAAVLSNQLDSRDHRQNWADWLAGDYIDRVFTMAYFDPGQTYRSGGSWTLELDAGRWRSLAHPERIAPGLRALYKDGSMAKTSEQFIAQVKLCRKYGFSDLAVFDERTVTNEILDALAAAPK